MRQTLDLVCQYVVKLFDYVPYPACYHHGHFVLRPVETRK